MHALNICQPPLSASWAVGAGAAVANSYYNQAFLGYLGGDFGLAAGAAAIVPVLTQAGNALGVLFLAPLGNRLERKSLILVTIAALVTALIGAAVSQNFIWLASASLAVGLFATVAQQLVPLAMHLAPPAERGRILGRVTGGILIGILLARTISGMISDLWGWPFEFWFAAALMIAIGVALARWLPRVQPTTDLSYPCLIGSLWTLMRTHRVLRQAVAVQFLIFAAFIGFWSNLALLADDGENAAEIGKKKEDHVLRSFRRSRRRRVKFHGNAVHAVAQARGFRPVGENVTQMAAAAAAAYRRAHHPEGRVFCFDHCVIERRPEAWPACTAVEFR
jgi:MFS family permease